MPVSKDDRDVVRELAHQIAEIAALPGHQEKFGLWRDLNGLRPTRPLVWIDEVPWHEVSEVEAKTRDERVRNIELAMRCLIYQWRHFAADMIVEPVWYTPFVFTDTGYGLQVVATRPELPRGAAHYHSVISSEADVEKIRDPVITPDWAATERRYDLACDLFGDILQVRKRGVVHEWCAPWDILAMWWGLDRVYEDMVDRPALVHKAIARLTDAILARLDQLEAYHLLSVSNGNHRVGSGGLGITDELPGPDFDPRHVRPMDQWGMSTGQIFVGVSPAMHDEFCVQYEKRYLARFGLNYYGCCEPLHRKIGILRSVPRLRKISISPWADPAEAAAQIGTDYVISLKPNPAVLASEEWDPGRARRELRQSLEQTRGCCVEVIMKDIHTFRGEPARLAAWAQIALEEAARVA